MVRSSARVASAKAKSKMVPPPAKVSKPKKAAKPTPKPKPKPKNKKPKQMVATGLRVNGMPQPKKNGDPPGYVPLHVTDISDHDIIMGRGNKVAGTPGNIRFRYIMQPYRKPYQQTESHQEKKRIIAEAYEKVNGRFLDVAPTNKFNGEGEEIFDYYTISKERCYEKIAQALREQKWTPVTTSHTAAGKKMIEKMQKEMAARASAAKSSPEKAAPARPNKTPPSASKKTEPRKKIRDLKLPSASTQKTESRKKNAEKSETPSAVTSSPPAESPALSKRRSSRLESAETAPDIDGDSNSSGEGDVPGGESTASLTAVGEMPVKEAVVSAEAAATGETDKPTATSPSGDETKSAVRRTSSRRVSKPTAKAAAAAAANDAAELKASKPPSKKKSALPKSIAAPAKPPRGKRYTEDKEEVVIDTLRENDVLLGRGNIVNTHPGNVAFRQFLHGHRVEYGNTPNNQKKEFAMRVLNEFGQRFVEAKPGTNKFRLVEVERCTEKICQGLRERAWNRVPVTQKSAFSSLHSMPNANPTKASFGDASSKKRPQKPDASHVKKRPKTIVPASAKSKTSKKMVGKPASVASSVASTELSSDEESLSRSEFGVAHENVLKIGSRIAVFWPMDKRYYSAIVEDSKSDVPLSPSTSPTLVLHRIRYEVDNEVEWLNLKNHEYKHLQNKSSVEPLTVEAIHTSDNTMSQTHHHKEMNAASQPNKVVKIMKGGKVKRAAARRNLFLGLGDVANQATEPAIIF